MTRVTIAALAGILLAQGAHAHAILMTSEPAAGASVSPGTLDLTFRYNSRIDDRRSRLTLISPDHVQTVLKIIPASQPDTLETSADLSKPGAYVVRWQVLAIDGHITRGDVPFTVTDH
jgi:methionine-rich copper-binding protein CopC